MSSNTKIGSEVVEHFSCYESFETPQHVFLREAFGEPALHVVDRSRVVPEPQVRDHDTPAATDYLDPMLTAESLRAAAVKCPLFVQQSYPTEPRSNATQSGGDGSGSNRAEGQPSQCSPLMTGKPSTWSMCWAPMRCSKTICACAEATSGSSAMSLATRSLN